jgi:hypothetical protein
LRIRAAEASGLDCIEVFDYLLGREWLLTSVRRTA